MACTVCYVRPGGTPSADSKPVTIIIPLPAKCSSRTDISHRLLFSCTAFLIHLHMYTPYAPCHSTADFFLFSFLSLVSRLVVFFIICLRSLSLLSDLDSWLWSSSLGLRQLHGVGTLQCKHDCPHHGARFMPFLFTPLGCIFMGAVLFNGNVENRGAAYLSELLPNV
jgi:hypothetical protein